MPGSSCAALRCHNRTYPNKCDDISFHRFPKDKRVETIWLDLNCFHIRVNPKTARICSAHFREDDFTACLRSDLFGLKSRKTLKKVAIPTKNLYVANTEIKNDLSDCECKIGTTKLETPHLKTKVPQTAHQLVCPQTEHQLVHPQTEHQLVHPQTEYQIVRAQSEHQLVRPQMEYQIVHAQSELQFILPQMEYHFVCSQTKPQLIHSQFEVIVTPPQLQFMVIPQILETSLLNIKIPINTDSSVNIDLQKEIQCPRQAIGYKQAHPLKVKQSQDAYRKAHPLKVKQSQDAYRKAHPLKVKQSREAYRKANRLKCRKAQKRYCLNNLEKVKEMKAAYRLRCRAKCKNGPSPSNELQIVNELKFVASPISLTNSAAICDDGLTNSIPVKSHVPVNLDHTSASHACLHYPANYQQLSELSGILVEESTCNNGIEIAPHRSNTKSTQTDKKSTHDIGVQCILLPSFKNINPCHTMDESAV